MVGSVIGIEISYAGNLIVSIIRQHYAEIKSRFHLFAVLNLSISRFIFVYSPFISRFTSVCFPFTFRPFPVQVPFASRFILVHLSFNTRFNLDHSSSFSRLIHSYFPPAPRMNFIFLPFASRPPPMMNYERINS